MTAMCPRPKRRSISRFNTASGMRSHVTIMDEANKKFNWMFQYRKRYEVTCDMIPKSLVSSGNLFQYRKRYEVTCDINSTLRIGKRCWSFNTASGMRSHVTAYVVATETDVAMFQYRKRYEVTCDAMLSLDTGGFIVVSIPQAV